MTYCLGCDLGAESTSWSRFPVGDDAPARADGSVASSVGVTPAGTLKVGDPSDPALTDVTSGFVASLGASEPIIVGGTPYGPEALVGCVLAEIVAVNVAATGSAPARFALVHDDGLDPYRISLLTEAARTAGISGEQLVLVPRSDAMAGQPDDEDCPARGAAAVAAASLPPSVGGASGISGAAAGAGAAGAAGGAAAAAGTAAATGTGAAAATGAAATGAAGAAGATGAAGVAGAAAAGPLGAAVGPAGAAGIAGPAGAMAGPAGAAVGPAGAAAGVAGPAGASGIGGAAATGAAVAAKSSIPWIPVAIAGGVVAVVLGVVGVAVIAGGGDDSPEAEAPVVTTVAEVVTTDPVVTNEPVETNEPVDTVAAEPTVPEETVAETTVAADAAGDLAPFAGTWQFCLQEDGISVDIVYVITVTGPEALNLDFTASGGEGGCGTGGTVVQESVNALTVDTLTSDGGATTITGQSDEGPFQMIVEGDSLTVIPPAGGDTIVLTRA